jgi:hypothetical protein
MVFTEIKPQIERLSREERLKALAFLKHLLRADSPANQADLTRRHDAFQAGRKISHDELKSKLGLS